MHRHRTALPSLLHCQVSDRDEGDERDDPMLAEERPVVVLTVHQAKGLEFDSVLIADPAAILAASPRGRNDLYVALTRATQRLASCTQVRPPPNWPISNPSPRLPNDQHKIC